MQPTAAVVLCLLLVPNLAVRAAGEESGAARWGDPSLLRRHLDAACTAVAEVCGARFVTRPAVQVSTPQDITAILRRRMGGEMGMLESTPDEQRQYLAYYDPMAHEIHILPGTLTRVAAYFHAPELLEEDVLRAVLVHEATHALDFLRFPVRWTLACCSASDERLATEAVLEGHAQLVTEEVCRRWGIESAFQRLTRLYTGALAAGQAADRVGFDQDAAFAYIQGHDFILRVQEARGDEGVDAVLRDPPFETRVIDRPELWLEPPQRGRIVDLQALLEVARPLVPASDWEVAKWRVLGPAVPLASRAGSRAGGSAQSTLDNHGLYAGAPDGNRYLNLFVAMCASQGDAARFVAALRGVDEARDDDPRWQHAVRRDGAGLEGGLPGFTSLRRAVGGSAASELALQVFHEGAYVVEFSTYGLAGADRAAQARALDLAARLLRASPPSAVAVALRAHVKRFLLARSRGHRGDASTLMRDLLPTKADLRRSVRPEMAEAFANAYDGVHLALRTSTPSNATVDSAFQGAGPDLTVRAWAATTEELAAGTGWTERFPSEMRAFARDRAAPGMTWVVLVLTPPGGAQRRYACFARFGDRFLWIRDPWSVLP